MARIKPQALLIQSKRKKGPARFSKITILACNILLVLLVLSMFAVHRRNLKKRHESLGLHDLQESDATGRLPGYAILNTTKGLIYLKLFGDVAPKTVKNFVVLSQNGYYNGVQFHRVIKNFMIQGGHPKGDGTGGESIWGGSFEDEFNPSLKHEPFTLSMANHGPNTNGSQFFITTVATPHLDNTHTVFGCVVQGQSVVKEIEGVETDEHDRPRLPVVIESISISDEI
eukprot:c21552_g2_i2 orf=247-930(+)